MGLFDLPAPLFAWIERQLAGLLPPALQILLWAVLAAAVGTELYRLLSPQRRIAAVKSEFAEAQRRLSSYDGEFDGAWPLMSRALGLAFRRLGLVLPAAIASSLPLLSLVVWLDTHYTRDFPNPGQPVEVSTPAPDLRARWREPSVSDPPRVVVSDREGQTIADVPVKAPVATIHKQRWWNTLLANPAGYLPVDAPVDRVDLALTRRELIAIGPTWLRGWEPIFFTSLLLCALTLTFVRRVE